MNNKENFTVRLPEKLKQLAEQRAEKLGMNKAEYIRYLITKDIENQKAK